MAKVHKLINEARATFLTKELKKSGRNAISEYSYFELSDFLPTVLQIFNEVGLCGIVSFTEQYATLTITAIEDDSKIEITSPFGAANLAGCMDIQNIGAVESYQRRYLWLVAMEACERDPIDSGAETLRKNPNASKAKSSSSTPSSPSKTAATASASLEESVENKQVSAFLTSIRNITLDQIPDRTTSARTNAKEIFEGADLEKVLTAITNHENILVWNDRINSIQVGETARITGARDLAKKTFQGEVLTTILNTIDTRELEITAS